MRRQESEQPRGLRRGRRAIEKRLQRLGRGDRGLQRDRGIGRGAAGRDET